MKKLIVSAVILGTLGYFGSKLLLHHKIESGVDQAVLAASMFVNIEYEGVSSTMTGELTIDGIRARINGFNDEIYIERLGIDTPSYFTLLRLTDIAKNFRKADDVIPGYFGFIAQGIHMKVGGDYMKELHKLRVAEARATDMKEPAAECTGKYGYSPDALAGLGYSEQVASISAHVRRGDGNYSMTFTSGIEDMWDLDAELILAGDMVSELSKGSRYRPRMTAMRLEYRDRSLHDRVRKYCSRLGLSDEDIVEAHLETLRFFGKEYGIEFDEYVIDPYTEFVSGKSKLVVTAKPSEPVSLSQISLYKPSDVPALLDLSAEAF